MNASYTFVDARFLDALSSAPNSPFADANGNIQVMPGNQIPAVPRNRLKAGFDYAVTDAFKVGGDALFVGSQYFVGDESNQFMKLPAYAVFNLHASYQIDKTDPDLRARQQHLRQSLRDLRHVLRHHRAAQFRQWRRAVHRPAIAQPGAAARPLCRHEGSRSEVGKPLQAAGPPRRARKPRAGS